MDKTEFIKLHDFDEDELESPDDILADNPQQTGSSKNSEAHANTDHDDLMKDLGI